jgi:DNA-binding SARP family transcriptional activator
MLWPEADEDNARSNLRHALWRIRKAIESDQVTAPYLLTDELTVSFNADADYWLDAAILARDGDGLQDQLDTLAVYRGELLPGFYDDWVTLERERLEARFEHKMQRLLDGLVEVRRWTEVLDCGERWVALGHAPEPGYRALMLAHAEIGNQSRVAAVYQRCREALFNDLGIEPSASTRQLYERLRRDDSESVAAQEVSAPTAVSLTDDAPAAGDPPFQGLPYFDVADADRFFGRERLTARLVARLSIEPFVAVLGASGSGKSSVVRAGLVPALRAGAVHVLTPTANPLEARWLAACSVMAARPMNAPLSWTSLVAIRTACIAFSRGASASTSKWYSWLINSRSCSRSAKRRSSARRSSRTCSPQRNLTGGLEW